MAKCRMEYAKLSPVFPSTAPSISCPAQRKTNLGAVRHRNHKPPKS